MADLSNNLRYKGFSITMNPDGTFRVRYRNDRTNKRYGIDHVSFETAGEWCFNMAANNDIAREINHKMCRKWGRTFVEDLSFTPNI